MSDLKRPSEPPSAICIRSPNWVGDVVMATPAFRSIRRHSPSARIVLVIRDKVAPVLRGAPWFNRILVYRTARGATSSAKEFLRCVSEIRRERCQLGFIFPNSFSAALMLRLGGVRRRVGYVRDARSLMLTDAVARPSEHGRFKPTYMVDYYLALCKVYGIEPDSRRTELPFNDSDMAAAKQLLERAGVETARPLFLLHPGAAFGPAKLWPEEWFAELAGKLHNGFGGQIACIGAPQERPAVQRIAQMCRTPLVDLTTCGIDLHLLKSVVRLSSLLVTTDSGPRHYGVALGVPTVCLMGPTHPAYSSSGMRHDIVVRVEVTCGPCQQKSCKKDHRCMKLLTTEMVLEKCREALQRGQAE